RPEAASRVVPDDSPLRRSVDMAARCPARRPSSVSPGTSVAHAAFIAHAETVLGSGPPPVRVLGIDETRRGRARWGPGPTPARGPGGIASTPAWSPWPPTRPPTTGVSWPGPVAAGVAARPDPEWAQR